MILFLILNTVTIIMIKWVVKESFRICISLVPRPFVKYKRTRQRMRVCREKGLVNNYASPRAQEFLLMVISEAGCCCSLSVFHIMSATGNT